MASSLLLGVNLAGAEFGWNVPGVFGTDYTYPTHTEIDYYAAKGMSVVRLPFLWERVQHSEQGPLDAAELGRLDDVVNYATGKGLKIEIEPHNYGYGFGALIGSAQTPNSAFADLWGKLAFHFQSNTDVIFGLMNEPHDQSASAWIGSANAAIAAIRAAGAVSQEILVPGSYWDGAWTWTTTDNATVVGASVQDPAHNFAFEVHQYLDSDGSGTHAGAVSATIGVERLTAITQWAEATGNHLFLGEVGVTTDQTSLTAFDGMLTYMQQHSGAWQGVTYWAGGPWWGDYMFSIEPQNGIDKPQMGILLQHLDVPSGDYNGTPGPDKFSAAGNLLQAFGNDGNDQLSVTGNQNHLSGGNGDDVLHANGTNNQLFGDAGNDSLSTAGGANQLFGGSGNDAYFIDNAGDAVIENAGEGIDTVYATAHFRLSANVENLLLQGSADFQAYGNGQTNAIYGNAGNNILDGGAGADAMYGGAGNDVYFVDNPGDAVFENSGEGSDTVFSTAHFRLSANLENLVLQGSADLQGFGNSQANALYGNAGNNLLDGGTGADVMVGGAGNDTYFVDDANDAVFENANEGTDVVFATAHFGLSANVEILVLQGGADLQGYGNSLTNSLYGNAGNNLLNGGAGADAMVGGAGNDTYFVDNAGDTVFENANEGTDAVFATVGYTLTSNVETLVLQGGGDLSGTGNALNNSIYGNSGDNTLNGGAGADVLTGNAGKDIFMFNAGQANGDMVVDFDGQGAGTGDSLQFSGFGTTAQGASFIQIGTTSQWQIHSGLDAHNEIITFINGAAVDPSDVLFA
jgi:Ca2+-binding RTX toxin-like protein